MSIIHIRQITAFLEQVFDDKINMKDWSKKSAESQQVTFLSRSLAAFSIMHLTGISVEESANAVVDGGKDNGIDAVYYHKSSRIFYLVQSKWKQNGSGSFSRSDLQKFLQGVKDLISAKFERFNKKIQDKIDEVDEALNNSETKILLLLSYTGQDAISSDVKQDLDDFLKEYNDATDVIFTKVLDQKSIYYAVAQGTKALPIDVEVMLYEWGQTREPYQSFYGQITVSELADWWEKYNANLFAPNIRTYLGETGVNNGIFETLKESPHNFWYYNNGITALCSSIRKKLIGGANRDSGVFECKDIRIVNGAQTVGTAARAFSLYPDSVQQAKVFIRFISLENCPENFDKEVTRSNNTQNKIDSRDFVALDPEQERIRNELRLEGITYVYKSGEIVHSKDKGFEIEEAALARACSSVDVSYSVIAKGKISRLWDDIEKVPYRALFNGGLTGPSLWKIVKIMRAIGQELDNLKEDRKKDKDHYYIVHGNLFITHLVFYSLPNRILSNFDNLQEDELKLIKRKTSQSVDVLISAVHTLFPDTYAANLFKNLKKCKELHDLCLQLLK
ncbi:MAG TPA: AIPR family protein [Leptolyngbyaceae cyanobacterium M65_K2018_010]|nr:AIPR family protein [Leptolyngbyaceae cyanobacterium M65_K2018_010]